HRKWFRQKEGGMRSPLPLSYELIRDSGAGYVGSSILDLGTQFLRRLHGLCILLGIRWIIDLDSNEGTGPTHATTRSALAIRGSVDLINASAPRPSGRRAQRSPRGKNNAATTILHFSSKQVIRTETRYAEYTKNRAA